MAIIAEDLGVITTDVNDLRKAIGAPGMVVLQFAWGSGATNTHIPHNHYENSVCYPGKSSLPCCAGGFSTCYQPLQTNANLLSCRPSIERNLHPCHHASQQALPCLWLCNPDSKYGLQLRYAYPASSCQRLFTCMHAGEGTVAMHSAVLAYGIVRCLADVWKIYHASPP